jgi:hypothetical protein
MRSLIETIFDVLALSKKDLDLLPATGAQEPVSHSTA